MIQPNGSGEPWFGWNKPVLDMFHVDGLGELWVSLDKPVLDIKSSQWFV